MNLFLIIMTNAIMSLFLISVAFLLPQMNLYAETANWYECGFDPTSSTQLPFSMKFFLVAITFLLFDLEIALLLPLPWAIQTNKITTMLTTALILVTILSLGLACEWMQKSLEWTE